MSSGGKDNLTRGIRQKLEVGDPLSEIWQILTRGDRFLILGLVLCIFSLFFLPEEKNQGGRELVAYSNGKWLGSFSLDKKQVLSFEGTVGGVAVEIDGQAARVIRAPCPRKLCMSMGWVQWPGEVVACLPNDFFIQISGLQAESGLDAVSQ